MKALLQFMPRFSRPVASRSQRGAALPTVQPSTAQAASRKDLTMYATDTVSVAAKLAAFAVAVIASAVVLGSTVAGMQPREDANQNLASLERVTITATRIN
jgi:hypothetical protein